MKIDDYIIHMQSEKSILIIYNLEMKLPPPELE